MELTLSGAEFSLPVITRPAALRHLVDVLGALTASDMPAIAVIGGMAVNIRLSTVRILTVGADSPPVEVLVAMPAGLIAAKSHAAGYPRAARRSTKHGDDLYDIFRLIEVFDRRGELRSQFADAPGRLGHLVAHVVQTEFLTNPARAMRQMTPISSTAINISRIIDVLDPFVAGVR